MHAKAVLGYLTKFKKVFYCSLFNYLSMDKVSLCHFIFFSRYQTKMCYEVLIQTVDDINFKISLGSTSKAMADREKKRGR